MPTRTLETLRVPAALLIGPMVAAILAAMNGMTLRLPRFVFLGAQGIIGCLIAHSGSRPIGVVIVTRWPLLLTTVLAIITASSSLGWLLAGWRVLPGAVAVWGSSPGAANVMMLMADAYGADIRLVAFMQYLRLVIVYAIRLAGRACLRFARANERNRVVSGDIVVRQLWRLLRSALSRDAP